ncbi:hypothetical protein [Nocardia cyriacigeorgica]|uniref:hypothetical protein n=1 Tax=Nocardia cyriacigeorgica TaxID=135487 RepID=UPI00189447D3|nr:hypothetical protein [Nocardia cyriacigeorgica]MBF6440169.1 hypothetical protein [Nocardia cyriacigeorgica]
MTVMTQLSSGSTKSTILVSTLLGFICGVAVLAVAAVWWQLGPSSVSCYYASYDPDTERTFGETAAKMWPTRWFWIGMIGAPTLAGAVFIRLTSRDA